MLPFLSVFLILNVLLHTLALPNGAPPSTCDTLLPLHGQGNLIEPLRSLSPFKISPQATAVAQGQILRIQIDASPPELTFGGFMLLARSTSPPYRVVGRFAPSADGTVKLMQCGGIDNAVTHTSTSPKRGFGFDWQAPADFVGEVIFNGTIAQEYDRFWVGLQSTPVQVLPKGQVPPSVGISTQRPPLFSSTSHYEPSAQAQTPTPRDPVYEGCGDTKSCFGFPNNCIETQDCKAIASTTVRGDKYIFDIKSGPGLRPAYIALGFSHDDLMGEDSVIECVPENGRINIYTSWTTAHPYTALRDNVPQDIMGLVGASYRDGVISCSFERDAVSVVRNQIFDLNNEKWHLFLAAGSSLKPTGVGYHDIVKRATDEPQFLSEVPQKQPSDGAEKIYEGCGSTKNCFGSPAGCEVTKSCHALSTSTFKNGKYVFELVSGHNQPAYVALGFSHDTLMGEDSVIECVPENGRVNIYSSWTSVTPYSALRDNVSQRLMRLLNASYKDGTIYCSFERDATTRVENTDFDLNNQKLHLFLVTGKSLKPTGVGYHDIVKRSTDEPKLLSQIEDTRSRTSEQGLATGKDSFYEGCGQSKSCFGIPADCVGSRSCQAVSAMTVENNKYVFDIKSGPGITPAYIALGFSHDNKMGQDSVIECVPENGVVNIYHSWTTAAPYTALRTEVSQRVMRLLDASHVDGVIQCRFERDAVSNVQNTQFDLINQQMHLLLAVGSGLKPGKGVGFHDIGKDSTAEPRFLAEVGNFGASSKLYLRLHGAFMIIAWIGCTSVGILLARYFKQTWVGKSACGKDVWFTCHRTLMVLTWLLTIAASVLIFLELEGWSQAPNPHAILGTITTVLCFIQPIGALFRPHPGHKNRPLFNWCHWLGGNLAHILAIVSIFFAVKLSKAELPEWMDFILVAYVAFHVFIHFIFSIAGCVSDKKHVQRVTSFPMTDISPSRNSMMNDRKQDAPYSGFKKLLLGIYIFVIILFVVALVVIVVLAPIESTVDNLKAKIMN